MEHEIQDNKQNNLLSAYVLGKLESILLMVKSDLHMNDTKSALLKINDLIKIIEEKVEVIKENNSDK